MFQLYKKRNFSELISDTFTFFSVWGKTYMRNYFQVNGLLMLVLFVVTFAVTRIFAGNAFTGIRSPQAQNMLEEYFSGNEGVFALVAIVFALLVLVITMTIHSYPVFYLALGEKKEPEPRELFSLLRLSIGKILLFFFLSLITFLPIAIIISLFSLLMFAIIIGIPVVVILFSALANWMFLSYYDYMSTDNGYFTALGNGMGMMFRKFWAHMGSTAIMCFIVFVLQIVLSLIPLLISGTFSFFSTEDNGELPLIIDIILFLLNTVAGYLLFNILMVNQGMIYYSCREEDEHRSLHSDIDLIGKDFE